MKSLRELYRVGLGPSSSHTMGPRFAALAFKPMTAGASRVRVTLFGSLAATGQGHLTDVAVSEPFAPLPVEILWRPEENLSRHPNGLRLEALADDHTVLAERVVYSVGGGALLDENGLSVGVSLSGGYHNSPEFGHALFEHVTGRGQMVCERVNHYVARSETYGIQRGFPSPVIVCLSHGIVNRAWRLMNAGQLRHWNCKKTSKRWTNLLSFRQVFFLGYG